MWSPPAKAVHIAYSHSYIIPPESLGCNKKLTNRFSPSTVGRKSIRCYRHVKINGYDGYATPAGGWANTPHWARVIIIVWNWDVIACESFDILFPFSAPSFARCRHYCSCEWFNVGCCCRWGSMGAVVRRVGDGAGVEEVMGAVGFIPTARVAQLFGSIFASLRYSVASQVQL